MIEGDLRAVRAAPAPPPRTAAPAVADRSADAAAPRCRRKSSPNCPIRPRPSRISPPRRANSMPPRRPSPRSRRAPSVKFSSRMPRRRAPRSNRACRPIIRSSRGRDRPGGRLRPRNASPLPKTPSAKLRQARASRPARPNFIAAARRAAQAAAAAPPADKAVAARSRAPAIGPASGIIDDHLEDSLAAGRRERGRDRARHVQDGDDAARRRQRAAAPGRGEFERSARRLNRPRRRHAPRPAPAAPSMTSPTPIGRQSFNDRRTDADGSASVAIPQPAAPAASPASDVTGAIPVAPAPAAGKLAFGADPADRKTAGRDRRPGAARRRAQGRPDRGL